MTKAKPILRTRTVSTKVTEEEFSGLEAQAAEEGVNLSEWVRDALLDRLKEPEEGTPDAGTILSEVVALRTIVINLMEGLARGESVTRERLNELIRYADTDRFRRAGERTREAAKRRKNQRGKASPKQ